jgi:hypothetical protein
LELGNKQSSGRHQKCQNNCYEYVEAMAAILFCHPYGKARRLRLSCIKSGGIVCLHSERDSLPGGKNINYFNNNSVALVRERTIVTERPPLVCEVTANSRG